MVLKKLRDGSVAFIRQFFRVALPRLAKFWLATKEPRFATSFGSNTRNPFWGHRGRRKKKLTLDPVAPTLESSVRSTAQPTFHNTVFYIAVFAIWMVLNVFFFFLN